MTPDELRQNLIDQGYSSYADKNAYPDSSIQDLINLQYSLFRGANGSIYSGLGGVNPDYVVKPEEQPLYQELSDREKSSGLVSKVRDYAGNAVKNITQKPIQTLTEGLGGSAIGTGGFDSLGRDPQSTGGTLGAVERGIGTGVVVGTAGIFGGPLGTMGARAGINSLAKNELPSNPDQSWGANPQNPQSGGGMDIGDLFGNLLPAGLGAYLGNSQRQDAMGQVGKINQLGDQLGDQSGAYLRSITDPYDQQTGLGRTSLTNALSQRGVGGSSFGNQQLENFDYMRGLGRQDIGTRAQVGLGALQGGLYGNALTGINTANQNYNSLLGAGLGASGSLFNRTGASGSGGIMDKLKSLGLNPSQLSSVGNLIGGGLTKFGGVLGDTFGSPGSSLWGTGDTGVSFTGGLPNQAGFAPDYGGDLNSLFGDGVNPMDWGF